MPRSIRSIAPPPPILAALIVALAALAWRVLYLTRLEGTVLAGLLEADSRVYWDWSRRILQAGWVGDHPFFFGPLYPYSLAAAAALGLRTLEGVRVLQSLVSTGTILLLTVTACRLHGVPWGLFCGLLCAGYSMWVFFDSQVLTESLLLALQILLLALTVGRSGNALSLRRAVTLGGIVGVMALGRATALLLLLPLGAWIIEKSGWTGARRSLAAMCAASVLLAVPTSLRSLAVGGELIPYTYSFGYNLFVGNGPRSNGTFQMLEGPDIRESRDRVEGGALMDGRGALSRRLGRPFTPLESSQYWTQRTLRHVSENPRSTLRLLAAKAMLMMNQLEAPQVVSSRTFEAVAGPMGWPLVGGFGCVGWLGLAGLPLAMRRSQDFRLVAGMVLAVSLSMLIFFVIDRYRVHLVPALALVAPLPIRTFVAALRARAPARICAPALLLALSGACVFRTLVEMPSARCAFEVHLTLANAHLRLGCLDQAATECAKAIAIDRSTRIPGSETPNGRCARAAVYELDGRLALHRGDWSRAQDGLRTAMGLVPGRASIRQLLAEAIAGDGGQTPLTPYTQRTPRMRRIATTTIISPSPAMSPVESDAP